MHKIDGAYLQCVNNPYTKFEYKGMRLLESQITQTRHPKSVADGRRGLATRPAFHKGEAVYFSASHDNKKKANCVFASCMRNTNPALMQQY